MSLLVLMGGQMGRTLAGGEGGAASILPFTDTFDGTGALASPWTGATWAQGAGAAVNTPTEGANLLTNGDLETWTTATNAGTWAESLGGGSTINQEISIFHGGANAARLDIDSGNALADLGQTPTLAVGDFFISRWWLRTSASGKTPIIRHENQLPSQSSGVDPGTTWTQYPVVSRLVTVSGFFVRVRQLSAASASIYVDDVTCNKLTFTSLFAFLSPTVADVTAKGAWTTVRDTLAGVAMNWDSTTAPANGVLCFHSGPTAIITLWKCVAGVWSAVLAPTAAAYVAGANVELRKSGTTYKVYYNGVQIGADQTISDAGIISNTIHGAFSTYAGNSITSFTLA